MARIRTIKPDFFTSEDITELSPLARLLYIGLWCEADREGRMVWKPKTFKSRYLPDDPCDILQLAQELVERNLVVEYGDGLAFIPTFLDHQHINPREAASVLAIPHTSATRRARVKHASAPVPHAQVGKEGKGKEGVLPSPEKPVQVAEESLLTLLLNDGSEFPVSKKQAREFQELYQSVDVPQQLKHMKAWLLSNPTRRKTKSGVLRFVNTWLAKAQDQGGPRHSGLSSSQPAALPTMEA